MIKSKYIIIITLSILTPLVGVAVANKLQNNTSEAQSRIQMSGGIGRVQKGNLKDTVSASGTIETANFLSITTSVNGIVKEVFVKEGDVVTKGQKIMEITLNADGEESRAQAWSSYLNAKNALAKAQTELLSLETSMLNSEIAFQTEKENNSYQTEDEKDTFKIAENNYLEAKAKYDNQQLAISQAQASLSSAWLSYQSQSPTIIAPSSGTVANIVLVEGMDITNSLSEKSSMAVAAIKNDGAPIANLNISEVDINKIQVGQKVDMTLNSVNGQTFTGTVVGIDKVGSVSSGVSNYPVIVKFDENSDLVLPNMGVDGDIVVNEKSDVLYIPTSAVQRDGDTKFVKKVGSDEKIIIKTGLTTLDNTEVLEGLSEGDQVQIQSLPTTGFTEEGTSSTNMRRGGVAIPFGGR